jgi:co-chaperonin GroES (HSP10)
MNTVKGKIRPLRNKILVKNIDQGDRVSKGGIILRSADRVEDGGSGVRARWAEVYAVGSKIDWLKPGEFVLMEHGRWTKGVQVEDDGEKFDLRVADPNGILGTSDTRPDDLIDGVATY